MINEMLLFRLRHRVQINPNETLSYYRLSNLIRTANYSSSLNVSLLQFLPVFPGTQLPKHTVFHQNEDVVPF